MKMQTLGYVAKSLILQVFFRYPKVLGDVVDIISFTFSLFLSEDIFGILPALFLLFLIPFLVLSYPIVNISVINIQIPGNDSIW